MKNKFLSVMLSGLIFTSMPIQMCANAIEDNTENTLSTENTSSVYAAGLIERYSLSCTGIAKTVSINASVYGSELMAKIGFKNIKIQRSTDKVNWTTEKTISDQIAKKAYHKTLSGYVVTVKGGYYYRVVLDNYALKDAWWIPGSQTVQATSNSVWVS